MVVKMKKYLFMVHHQDYLTFLKKLRSCGVVHVERAGKQSEESGSETITDLNMKIARLHKAIRFFQHRKQANEPQENVDVDQTLKGLEAKQATYDKAQAQHAAISKEIQQLEPWGEFSPAMMEKLAASGIRVRLFFCTSKHFDPAWEEQYSLEIINRSKTQMFFALFDHGDGPDELPSCEELPVPERSLSVLTEQLATEEHEMARLDKEFDKEASLYLEAFESKLEELLQELDFENVRESGELAVEESIVILQGWVPNNRQSALETVLQEKAFVGVEVTPEEGETPPIVLKNGFFSRLFEPISKMFSLPDYMELDLTAAFAPFFTLFFGLCLGDAGYGILILVGTLVGRFFVQKKWKPIMTLGSILGLSTTVVGVLTGTVFGVWLTKSGSSELQQYILLSDSEQIFYLSLAIGVVQILFGMLIQMVNRIRQMGFAAGLAPFGWFVMIISLLGIMLESTHQSAVFTEISGITVWVGIALILLFNDVKANIFVRLGKGLWELYNITGFFGDVLSYVRLFALGISSAILGLVVNNIAGQMQAIPFVGPVIFVFILVVGHTGNMLLSGLGAFVHPMRLTFVEFYNNAGFSGGGRAYKPFTWKKHTQA